MEFDEELDSIDLGSSTWQKQVQHLHPWSNTYHGPPDLLLWEKKEIDAKNRSIWAAYKLSKGTAHDSTSFYEERDSARLWRLLRFFESVEGFLKGELDLTGRHLPRWNVLHKSFQDYLVDFLELWPTIKLVVTRAEMKPLLPGEYLEIESYEATDNDLWARVMSRWRLSESQSDIAIDGMTRTLKKYVEANGVPRIQKLCLLDLANELLYAIFSRSSFDSARMLSITCKRLNAIGRHYIFRRRTLSFEHPHTKVDYDLPLVPQYTELAQTAKAQLMASADFLFSRPDLCQKVETLSLSNDWDGSLLLDSEGFSLDDVESGFMAPITEIFTRAVSLSIHLTSLHLFRICLDLDMLRSICNLQSINILETRACDLPVETREPLFASSLRNSHLLNLDMVMGNSLYDGPWNVWFILVLFPNLRTLNVSGNGNHPLRIPPGTLWSRETFVDTLERLCIGPLHSADANNLALWLYGVPGSPRPLRLTHFKLSVKQPLRDAIRAMLIILALETAPLKVLVLEGIHRELAFPRLIRLIADQFPDLIGLTLVMRDSNRQRRNQAATWPLLSWEYALGLTRFNHLEYFGWNYLVNQEDASTRTLLLFENGFIEEDDWERMREEDEVMAYDCDDHSAVLPFVTRCSTLKSFGLLGGNRFSLYQVERELNGTVNVKLDFQQGIQELQRWDPGPFRGGWPYITNGCDAREVD